LLQHANEYLTFSAEHGLGFQRALGLVFRGWCLAALENSTEAIPLLTAGLTELCDLGLGIWRPWGLTLLGDACRMAGQLPAALRHLAEARHLAEETQERWAQAETLRLHGDLLLATGDPAAAEAGHREAIAQRQSAKLWELRAATSLARLWRDQGKRSEAYDLLAPVYGWFTEGFGTPVLEGAKALLAELAP
jgi:predicted ATPase